MEGDARERALRDWAGAVRCECGPVVWDRSVRGDAERAVLAGVVGSAADKQGPQGRGWGRARAMLARWAAVWSAGPGERDGPREREWSGWVKGLDSFSNSYCISKSNPNSISRQMNSNLNLNSHKHSTNKTMLQHECNNQKSNLW